MSPKTIGLLLGGVCAAFLFGFSGVLQKMSNSNGIGVGPYMTLAGIAVTLVGAVAWIVTGDHSVNVTSGLYAFGFGAIWGIASLLIALSLAKYGSNISQLVPLYNMNTLVAVAVGLVLLGEHRSANPWYLIPGTVAIVIGGYLCSRA